MVLDAKHGLLGEGRIRIDRRRSKVRRDTGGWYVVEDSSPWGNARVLYREAQDLAVIQWSGAVLRIPFRAGEADFDWEDRPYHIGSMIEGEIHIQQEGRAVARGHVTVTGLHLDTVATELLPIIRPLVWTLVLRSEAVARMNWVPSPPGAEAAVPPPRR